MKIVPKEPIPNFHVQVINHNVKSKKDLILVEYFDINKNWYSHLSGITKEELHELKTKLQESVKWFKTEMRKDSLCNAYYKEKLERAVNELNEVNKHGSYSIWYTQAEFNEKFNILNLQT